MRGLHPLNRLLFEETDPSPVSPALRAVDPPSPTRGEGQFDRD